MTRLFKALFTLSLVALASCSDTNTVIESLVQPQFSHGDDGSPLLFGQLPNAAAVSEVIGPRGGYLVMRGPDRNGMPTFHSLVVPAGAVHEELLFTMAPGSPDHIDVELHAYRIKKNAKERGAEVGHLGFQKTLYLTLSYAWADGVDPSRLGIVYVVGNDIKERVRTLPLTHQKMLIGEIRHFSRYGASVQ